MTSTGKRYFIRLDRGGILSWTSLRVDLRQRDGRSRGRRIAPMSGTWLSVTSSSESSQKSLKVVGESADKPSEVVAVGNEHIDRMVWEELSHRLHVFYAGGREESGLASYDAAAQYATSVGLSVVPATPGRVEWMRVDRSRPFDDDFSFAYRRRGHRLRWLRRSAT